MPRLVANPHLPLALGFVPRHAVVTGPGHVFVARPFASTGHIRSCGRRSSSTGRSRSRSRSASASARGRSRCPLLVSRKVEPQQPARCAPHQAGGRPGALRSHHAVIPTRRLLLLVAVHGTFGSTSLVLCTPLLPLLIPSHTEVTRGRLWLRSRRVPPAASQRRRARPAACQRCRECLARLRQCWGESPLRWGRSRQRRRLSR